MCVGGGGADEDELRDGGGGATRPELGGGGGWREAVAGGGGGLLEVCALASDGSKSPKGIQSPPSAGTIGVARVITPSASRPRKPARGYGPISSALMRMR